MDCEIIDDKNTITKLKIKGQTIYVKLNWKDNQDELFHIKLYDGNKAWSGILSPDCANLVDESIEEYKLNVKRGFLESSERFVFNLSVESCGKKACFSWLKVFEDQTEMPYGSLEVHIDEESEAKNSLIDNLIDKNNKQREVITLYARKNKALNDNFKKCKSELEECVSLKNSLETNLYGKFVQVLNEKKKRIQILEEHIQKYE